MCTTCPNQGKRHLRRCSCGRQWQIRRFIPTHGKPVAGYWCTKCDEIDDNRSRT